MNMILSILLPFVESLRTGVPFDVSFGPLLYVGLAVIIAVGIGLIVLIVLAVKFLLRIRKNRTKNV
jgi:hypothetical protein